MRKVLQGLLGALAAMMLAGAAVASTFSDLPTDHWAYDAIDYLQQAGLVEGYPDGTFQGDRPFTRYEMAMVIARVFTKIQDWQAMYNGGTMPGHWRSLWCLWYIFFGKLDRPLQKSRLCVRVKR